MNNNPDDRFEEDEAREDGQPQSSSPSFVSRSVWIPVVALILLSLVVWVILELIAPPGAFGG
ncbi:MAG: hypothetical protein LBG44_05740 [Gemmatimonadota bacterium]|jgi:hypothetical protein|nr:hypothetical protein [Gemmatimonadota bacterium]